MLLEDVYSYADRNVERYVREFQEFVRQPSISARGEGIAECSQLVERMMRDLGIQTGIYPFEEGSPVVYGELPSEASRKTLLIYSHYDVQPPEPLELWRHEPFSATLEEEKIYGRGASDAKGNLFVFLKAVEALKQTAGSVPVGLMFLFEGEEEISSPHLPVFVQENKSMLKADAVIAADGSRDEDGAPKLSLGLKGILYVELSSQTSKTDHHSMRAPLVANPAWRLVWALSTIKDRDERILVDGWYDRVLPLSKEERELIKGITFNDEEVKAKWGVSIFLGDARGAEALQRLISQPTATICGFDSGYKGSGAKTVLPSRAAVKIDFRLVPDQDPDEQFERLKKHLEAKRFDDIDVVKLGKLEPSKTPVNAPIVRVLREAAEKAYGRRAAVYPNSPGSGPDYVFTKLLGLHSVWTGCSPASSNIHAPNEFTTIQDIVLGIKYAATIMCLAA